MMILFLTYIFYIINYYQTLDMMIVYWGVVFFIGYIGLLRLYHVKSYKITQGRTDARTMRLEIKNNIYATIIYSLIIQGFYWLYQQWIITFHFDLNWWIIPYGIALVIFHDAYFYFLHRLIHTKFMYKYVHIDHHRSHNPTLLSAYNFHPVEAVLYVGAACIVFFVDVQFYALAFAIFYNDLFNFLGHSWYEFLEKKYDNIILKYLVVTTYHDLHHSRNKWNYGLYFTWRDKWFGTYDATYDEFNYEKHAGEWL